MREQHPREQHAGKRSNEAADPLIQRLPGSLGEPGPATKNAEKAQGGEATGTPEIQQLPAFTALTGAHVEILHVYSGFTVPVPTTTLDAIESYGATPMLDWACGNVTDIAAGRDDTTIRAYAAALKAFTKPVFLRWYWEMNLQDSGHASCGSGDPAAFVAAWRHIHDVFAQQGAENVAFVWSPSGDSAKASENPTPYYPGDTYVDWIGVDHYDIHGPPATGTGAVSALFGGFYRQWSSHGKPLMIAETGAQPADQAGYLQGLQQALPQTYPDFKAVVYFDSPGKKGPYDLQRAGVTAFRALARDPYFTFGRS